MTGEDIAGEIGRYALWWVVVILAAVALVGVGFGAGLGVGWMAHWAGG